MTIGYSRTTGEVSTAAMVASVIAGVVGGAGIAKIIFHNRSACIEAFASRYCTGVANISILFAPVMAMVYAHVRGLMKLAGR